jgi:hypothetical protein
MGDQRERTSSSISKRVKPPYLGEEGMGGGVDIVVLAGGLEVI